MNYTLENDFFPNFINSYNKAPSKSTFSIRTKTIWADYYYDDGRRNLDLDSIGQFQQVLESGIKEGFFSGKRDKNLGIYKQISATNEQVLQMAVSIGRKLKPEYDDALRSVLREFTTSSCPQVAAWAEEQLAATNLGAASRWFKFSGTDIATPKNGLRTLLQGCEQIHSLDTDMLQRSFSVRYYAGSKDFENNYRDKTAAIMAPLMYSGGVPAPQILKTMHILQNPASVWLKGYGHIDFANGDKINCSDYPSSFALSRAYVEQIKFIQASNIMTIENLTTFNELTSPADTIVVFTSGYANSLTTELITKCARDNRISTIKHFGDMDAYGFDILRNLATRTGLRVEPFFMDAGTYLKHKADAVPITKGNIEVFHRLLTDSYFSEETKGVFSLLLEQGQTLEQESLQMF